MVCWFYTIGKNRVIPINQCLFTFVVFLSRFGFDFCLSCVVYFLSSLVIYHLQINRELFSSILYIYIYFSSLLLGVCVVFFFSGRRVVTTTVHIFQFVTQKLINLYIPHENGRSLRPALDVKVRIIAWFCFSLHFFIQLQKERFLCCFIFYLDFWNYLFVI